MPHLAVYFTIEAILKKRLSPEEEGIDTDKIIFVPGSCHLWHFGQAVSL